MAIKKSNGTFGEGEIKPFTEEELKTWKWPIRIFLVVATVLLIGWFVYTTPGLMTAKTSQDASPEVKTPAENAAVNTATTSVQETTNTAGIAVSLAGVDFNQAEEWKLNTLYVDPKNPGNGVLLVRMQDIEFLQPFRIANAEYSNFRLEKHERDAFGFVGELRADTITPQRKGKADLWIQVFDKLPQRNGDGAIANGAITLFTSDGRLEKLPPSNSVLRIEVTQ